MLNSEKRKHGDVFKPNYFLDNTMAQVFELISHGIKGLPASLIVNTAAVDVLATQGDISYNYLIALRSQ